MNTGQVKNNDFKESVGINVWTATIPGYHLKHQNPHSSITWNPGISETQIATLKMQPQPIFLFYVYMFKSLT